MRVSAGNLRSLTLGIVGLLVASACANSAGEPSANIVGVDPIPTTAGSGIQSAATEIPGGLYLTTSDGDLVFYVPSTSAAEVVVSAADDTQPFAFEVAPHHAGQGLTVLLSDRTRRISTSLHTLTNGTVTPVANDFFTSLTVCLDPHVSAHVSMGHELQLTDGSQGSVFAAVPFRDGAAAPTSGIAPLTRTSVACPRWSSDRSLVATAAPLDPNNAGSSVALYMDSADASHELALVDCNVTPAGFSPDDAYLAVDVGCFGGAWASSGLYLIEIDGAAWSTMELTDLVKVADGRFGHLSWHSSGDWIAAVYADLIPDQTRTTPYSDQPLSIAIVNLATQDLALRTLAGNASPTSLAWLDGPVR